MTYTLLEAAKLHRALPPEGWMALRQAGLSDAVVHARLLGWDGEHITIPVFGPAREIVWMDRASFDDRGLLVQVVSKDAPSFLYNAAVLEAVPPTVVIAEGISECLVLLSQRIDAIAGTGAGRLIPPDALENIYDIREVIICFKYGPESREAACQLAAEIPDARLMEFPESFQSGEGVGIFFAKRHKRREDFMRLLSNATPLDEAW